MSEATYETTIMLGDYERCMNMLGLNSHLLIRRHAVYACWEVYRLELTVPTLK